MTTRKQRELIVIKKPAYVWRVYSWGMGENFNFIPCWYVVDKNTNEIVAGGFNSGSNCQSGYAYIPRKKDAKAFIEGYNAESGSKNPHSEWVRDTDRVGKHQMLNIRRKLKGADENTAQFWDKGNEYVERGKLHNFKSIS